MCGRYTLAATLSALARLFPGVEFPDLLRPRYNIAPTQEAGVIASDDPGRMRFFRWGLIPSWAKDKSIGNRMINARAETVMEKPAFKGAFQKRRCLVLADGFYEWRNEPGGKGKTPMYVRLATGEPFAFAGLWEVWRSTEEDPPIRSFTILTTEANARVAGIHDRMPVVLHREAHAAWLEAHEGDAAKIAPLLRPYDADAMEAYPVAKIVNSPANDVPECIEPVGRT